MCLLIYPYETKWDIYVPLVYGERTTQHKYVSAGLFYENYFNAGTEHVNVLFILVQIIMN